MTSEHLPFKNFGMNAAYYYLMVIGHLLLGSYRDDVLLEYVPSIGPACYPEKIRRRAIDFAASIVHSGGYVILKITRAVNDILDAVKLWKRCTGEGIKPLPLLQ